MSLTPKTDRELADLIEHWHCGELDQSSQAKLLARLEADPAARKAFREATRFEAMLHLEYPDNVVHLPKARPAWYRKAIMPLAAAAVVALIATLGPFWRSHPDAGSVAVSNGLTPSQRPSTLIDSTPVARVDSVSGLTLDPASMPLEAGALLIPGKIHMRSGKAEITFLSGARVSLDGPCEFILKSDFRASLTSGRMTTHVPQEAIGFTVHTPTGQVRDLGTSFALNVDSNGVSDVHVLDGEVEASSEDGSSVKTLAVHQASRISKTNLIPIAFTAEGWPVNPAITHAPTLPDSVHWSFDNFDGDKTLDAKGEHPLWARGDNPSANQWPARAKTGVIKHALGFNGKDQYAESTYRGVSGNNPRTVSLWINIPPDASHEYPNGILSWGSPGQSRKWQLCWNNGDQGTIGAMRVEFGDGYLIGTTNLRDGRYHHLCAVYLGGGDSDVASHVKLYVDGRLESLSGRRSQFIRTDTESSEATTVTLGRWLGYWPGKKPFCLNGEIDEVHIFEQALTPSQVASLAGIKRER